MTDQEAIRIDSLSKSYRLGMTHDKTIRDTVNRIAKRFVSKETPTRQESYWALRDVSLSIREGEVTGIIGRNGAGKSTLLKILSKITSPTSGRIEMYGRVASLLEVGTGFHPELSGRENVFLNGTILGMTRAEVAREFDEIVAFSGIEQFIDTPVKRYSSGMRVRLGFAVAAHLNPEILIIDEVLAVGDAEFQSRCLSKMNDVATSGRTVLFVSHNMGVVRSLCQTAVYLKDGQIASTGPSDQVVGEYLIDAMPVAASADEWELRRKGSGEVRLTAIRTVDTNTGDAIHELMSGQDVTFEIDYVAPQSESVIERFNLGLSLATIDTQFVTVFNSEMAFGTSPSLPVSGTVRCRIERFPLMAGRYVATSTLRIGRKLVDQVPNACELNVVSGHFYETGIQNEHGRQGVYVPQQWSFPIPATALVS